VEGEKVGRAGWKRAYFTGGRRRGEVKRKGSEMGKWREGEEGKGSPWCPQPLTPSAAYEY